MPAAAAPVSHREPQCKDDRFLRDVVLAERENRGALSAMEMSHRGWRSCQRGSSDSRRTRVTWGVCTQPCGCDERSPGPLLPKQPQRSLGSQPQTRPGRADSWLLLLPIRRRCCGPPPGHLNNKDSADPGPAVPMCLPLCPGVPLSLCRALVIQVLGLSFTAEGTEAERAQGLAQSHKTAVVRQDLNSGHLTPKPCSYSSLPHPHQPPGSSTQPRPAQGKRHL